VSDSLPSKTLLGNYRRMPMDKYFFTRAFFVLGTSFFLTATVALAQEPVTEAMVRHVAQTYHISAERLKVGHETSKVLPLTGKRLYLAKILDTTTGKAYGVAADETGTIVDTDSLRAAERRGYAERYGKLSPRLFERVEQTGSDETLRVLVWLDDGGELPAAPHLALGGGKTWPL
jgi:hypothetical protein